MKYFILITFCVLFNVSCEPQKVNNTTINNSIEQKISSAVNRKNSSIVEKQSSPVVEKKSSHSSSVVNGGIINEAMAAAKTMCVVSANKGEKTKVEIEGEANAKVKLINLIGKGKYANEKWNGIQQVLQSNQFQENQSIRDCNMTVFTMVMQARRGN